MRVLSPFLLATSLTLAGGLADAPAAHAAAPTCSAADGATLMPGDAEFVATVDLSRLTRTTPWRDYRDLVLADPNVQKTLTSLATCNVNLQGIDEIWLGYAERTRKGPDDQVAVVVHAPNIGTESTMRCLAGVLKDPQGTTPKLQRRGCANEMIVDGGDGHVLGLDSDHLAVVSKGWTREVLRRASSRARPGKVASQLTGVSSHMRFALAIDKAMQAKLGPLGAQVKGASGSLVVSDRLRGELVLDAGTAAEASNLQSTLQGYLGLARGMGSSAGIPNALFDGITISDRKKHVTIAFDLSYADLKKAAAANTP